LPTARSMAANSKNFGVKSHLECVGLCRKMIKDLRKMAFSNRQEYDSIIKEVGKRNNFWEQKSYICAFNYSN
jgi:hypothetical protein